MWRYALTTGMIVAFVTGCQREQPATTGKAGPPKEEAGLKVEELTRIVDDLVAEKPGDIPAVDRVMMFLELGHVNMTRGSIQENEKKSIVVMVVLLSQKVDETKSFDSADRERINQKMAEVLTASKLEPAMKLAVLWKNRDSEKK